MTLRSFLYIIYFVNVCDDCVFSPNKPPDLTLLYGLWSKSSSTAIIDGTPLSIIQPYIWLANRIDDRALHWILTHQSHTWPWAVVIFTFLYFCLSVFVSIILCVAAHLYWSALFLLPTYWFRSHFCLPSMFSLLSSQSLYITDIPLTQFLFPSVFCKSSVTGCHFIPTVLHLHQQVSNVTIARRQGRTIENHGGDTVCICVMGESEETEVREIWVSGYSDGTESLFEDSRDWYPRCFCSQPPWAQQKPKK